MKKHTFLFFSLVSFILLSGCQSSEVEKKNEIVIGFSQLGNESAWRERNTQSVIEAATHSNVKLLVKNAQQSQEKQIKDVRAFIASRVDVIILSPIVSNGWNVVLNEAKDAGIPVFLNDRSINDKHDSLYQSLVGTNGFLEGEKAAHFLKKKFESETSRTLNIVEITGTSGSSSSYDRGQGFQSILKDDPKFSIIAHENGDFMLSKGRQAIEKIANTIGLEHIDIIFSHNDDMTIGIVKYLETTSFKPGKDIVIVSVDAQQEALNLLKDSKINCTVECNPNTGPKLLTTINHFLNKGTIEKKYFLEEQVFSEFLNLSTLSERGY